MRSRSASGTEARLRDAREVSGVLRSALFRLISIPLAIVLGVATLGLAGCDRDGIRFGV